MLKEFRVSNFKSINKEQIFSMEACSPREVTEYPNHVINFKGERLLKLSSFYGPNGGGKSNLLDAFISMLCVVMNKPIKNRGFGDESYMSCVFCQDKNTIFEVFYITENYEIGYSLTVDLTKTKGDNTDQFYRPVKLIDYQIIKEEMVFRKLDQTDFLTLFEREKNGVIKSNMLEGIDLIRTSSPLSTNMSFIEYFHTTFMNVDTNKSFAPLFEFLNEINGTVIFSREHTSYTFSLEHSKLIEPHLKKIADILNSVDIRVKGLVFRRTLPNSNCLYVQRETRDGKITEIQSSYESNGTKKLLNFIIDLSLSKGSKLFIADDFDAFLHPKLIRTIIELFSSESNNNKQLLINSHDIINMNNKVFRRDEIWFAYRDDDYSTRYIPLSNIVDYKGKMIRKDASYGKQYLEGKYGADPFIKQGLNWE